VHRPRARLAAPLTADALLAAGCVGLIAVLLADIMTFGYGRDQGIYAMVARAIVAGKMPYRDAWDFKPPGIFLVYAAARATLGNSPWGIRLVECLGIMGMVVGMVRLTERFWGSRLLGLFAGAMATLVHAQLDFWHTAQPESFGGMLTVAALVVLGPGPWSGEALPKGREALLRWAGAGAIFGFTGLLKPPLAGGGAVVAVAIAIAAYSERRSARDALLPTLALTAGGALPIALCLAWFFARGALRDLWEVLFVFTPHYTKLSWEGETLSGMAYWGFTEWLCSYSSVPTLGLFLTLGLGAAPRERPGAAVLLGIIAMHLVGVTMQGKFFPYHFGATWPLTALVASLGFFRVWERLGKSRLGLAAAPLFMAGVALSSLGRSATKDLPDGFGARFAKRLAIFSSSPRDARAVDALASVADVDAAENRAVAEALRARVPAGEPVFVWGFEPVIYDLADRDPATRYLYDVPQRVAWAKAKERATLMLDLGARRPRAIVVERRDVFPMVTGDAIDSADTLPGFPELEGLLAGGYRREESIGDFDLYLAR
jgi:hypothetical protein